MGKLLIAAVSLLCVCLTTQADSLAGLGAKLIEASGAKAPVLVFPPGIKLNISGRHGAKAVEASGDDKCPRDFLDQGAERNGCTVLDKPVVTVHFVDDGKLVTEKWTVVTKDGRTYLNRPDGTIISQAH